MDAASKRLRAAWRLTLFLVSFLALLLPFTGFLSLWHEGDSVRIRSTAPFISITSSRYSAILALFFASWLAVRFLDRRPFGSFGLLHTGWWKEVGIGWLLGFALAGVVHLLAAGLWGAYEIREGISWPRHLWGALVVAAHEELLFRGYLLQVLIEGLGTGPAVLVTSLLFGLSHQGLAGALNALAGGLLMASLFLRRRSLWVPIGLHWGWDFQNGIWTRTPWLPPWPAYLAAGVSLAACIAVWSVSVRPHPKVEALWQQHVHPANPWTRLRDRLQGRRPRGST